MIKKIISMILCLILLVSMSCISLFSTSSASPLIWPVPGHRYSLYQGLHNGNAIDISDGTIYGADIVAAMGGVVTHIFKCTKNHAGSEGDCHGFGTGVVINGDDGRVYQYAHMLGGSIPTNVYNGAYVSAGQKIGQVGNTGASYGAHLHFGIAYGQYYHASGIDPWLETYVEYLNAPTTATVNVEKSFYQTGENIALTMSSDAYVAYAIGIDDANGNRIATPGVDYNVSTYTFTLDEPGTYSCYVTAYNNAGMVDSAKISFTVYNQKPSYSDLTLDLDAYQIDDNVIFNVSGDNATSYTVTIDNEAGERVDSLNLSGDETFITKSFDVPGKYSCFVTATNNCGSTDSERVYFTVYRDLSDMNGEWTYVDTLPEGITEDKYEIQYQHKYEIVDSTAPGAEWKKGDLVKTQLENSGEPYWSNIELETSDTRVLLDYHYYHYCSGSKGLEANYESNSTFSHYDALGKESVYEYSVANDYADSRYKFYHLKWNSGYDAYCASDVSCDGAYGSHGYRSYYWYKSSQYQDKAAVEYHVYSKRGVWTTEFDNTASSVTYRYKLKDSATLIGDVNDDTRVNVQDATLIQKYCASLVTLGNESFLRADANRNGKVNIQDATLIQKFVAGLVPEI